MRDVIIIEYPPSHAICCGQAMSRLLLALETARAKRSDDRDVLREMFRFQTLTRLGMDVRVRMRHQRMNNILMTLFYGQM